LSNGHCGLWQNLSPEINELLVNYSRYRIVWNWIIVLILQLNTVVLTAFSHFVDLYLFQCSWFVLLFFSVQPLNKLSIMSKRMVQLGLQNLSANGSHRISDHNIKQNHFLSQNLSLFCKSFYRYFDVEMNFDVQNGLHLKPPLKLEIYKLIPCILPLQCNYF